MGSRSSSLEGGRLSVEEMALDALMSDMSMYEGSRAATASTFANEVDVAAFWNAHGIDNEVKEMCSNCPSLTLTLVTGESCGAEAAQININVRRLAKWPISWRQACA